ncbi:MAG: heterodisulfide reductase [Desulfobacterales bacterium]|nr:heterodisulfide reductase [Desulfobacterales bacterium]
MADGQLLQPDLQFIQDVKALGGGDLKKCFQCATCSVACPISPDNKPFPRKEMIAASWGLKDRLVANHDIWLCHNCGDCSTLCPRQAGPGETLGAIRSYTIADYAAPKALGKLINDPKKLPIVVALPAIIFLVIGMLLKVAGVNWLNFSPNPDEVVQAHFFSTWLVDIIMIPTFFSALAIFGFGLWKFVNDAHANALATGKTDKEKLDIGGVIKGIITILPTILKHDRFSECGENKERATAHLMVFYSFIGLFIVTNIFFVTLYVLGIHGPYSQLNPVKWLGNISGVALVIGSLLLIKNRLENKDQKSNYVDWYLLGLVFMLGFTGMGTQITRLADLAFLTYALYFIHLMCVWLMFAFLPFSKMAHLAYRTVSMGYNEWTGRK